MKVKDVMHTDVEWVDPDLSIMEIATKMREQDIGAAPVGENDKIIGMITDRDITCRAVAAGSDPSMAKVRDVMTEGVIFCVEDEELADAAITMKKKKIRRLPVLNQDKRMVGMLSLGDLSHAASHELSGEVIEAVSAHH